MVNMLDGVTGRKVDFAQFFCHGNLCNLFL